MGITILLHAGYLCNVAFVRLKPECKTQIAFINPLNFITMAKQLTAQQVNKKYKDVYVEFGEQFDYAKRIKLYTILKTSPTIRENMTLGQDVNTPLEYCR